MVLGADSVLAEDQRALFTEADAAKIVIASKGLRNAVQIVAKLNASKVPLSNVAALLAAVEDATAHIITVTNDMREEFMSVLGAPDVDLFEDIEEIDFTVGEVDDMIAHCFGLRGAVAALMRFLYAGRKFSSFQDLVLAMPHHPFPDQGELAALRGLLAGTSVVDASDLDDTPDADLVDLLLVGGGSRSLAALLGDMESQGQRGHPVHTLAQVLFTFLMPTE